MIFLCLLQGGGGCDGIMCPCRLSMYKQDHALETAAIAPSNHKPLVAGMYFDKAQSLRAFYPLIILWDFDVAIRMCSEFLQAGPDALELWQQPHNEFLCDCRVHLRNGQIVNAGCSKCLNREQYIQTFRRSPPRDSSSEGMSHLFHEANA